MTIIFGNGFVTRLISFTHHIEANQMICNTNQMTGVYNGKISFN